MYYQLYPGLLIPTIYGCYGHSESNIGLTYAAIFKLDIWSKTSLIGVRMGMHMYLQCLQQLTNAVDSRCSLCHKVVSRSLHVLLLWGTLYICTLCRYKSNNTLV